MIDYINDSIFYFLFFTFHFLYKNIKCIVVKSGMYYFLYETIQTVYTYAYLVIILTVLVLIAYIKFRFPFWSSQPIYHTYDFIRWLYLSISWTKTPYLIQTFKYPLKTKFISHDNVITIPYSDISSFQENEFVNLLQCHSFSDENILNILDKTTIQSLLIGLSYISFFQEDRISLDISNNIITEKETIGCMSSRPIHCILTGDPLFKTTVYLWDHICIHRTHEKYGKIPRKNVAYKMIQTHEYRQRLINPNIGASLFKKEGLASLCDGVVPLVKFQIITFELYRILKPPLSHDMTVVNINADDIYDMIYGLTHTSSQFILCMFPEIGSLTELIKNQILHVYALKQKDRIIGVYFLKDTQIVYDFNNKNNTTLLECISSVDFENSPYFFAGFLGALHNIFEIKPFKTIRFPNLGHNIKIIEKWRWKYPPISEISSAYYIYNMIIPQMPIPQNKTLILF